MSAENNNTKQRRVPGGVAVACILTALYAPQSWLFFTDYAVFDGYWKEWLRLLPGLPVFVPVGWLTHTNETLMMASLWAGAAILAGVLFMLSRKRPVLFWFCLAAACVLSILSALGAHSAFVA